MSEKSCEKTLRLGPFEFTPTDPHMTFDDLIHSVDETLRADMESEGNEVLLKLYDFFNTKRRPLDPREFYEFLGSWSIADKIYYEMAGDDLPEGN